MGALLSVNEPGNATETTDSGNESSSSETTVSDDETMDAEDERSFSDDDDPDFIVTTKCQIKNCVEQWVQLMLQVH